MTWLVMAAVLAARLAFYAQAPYAAEDAYIYFRHAENLAHGHLGINSGQTVMGVTSLPWLLWLTLGAVLKMPLILWGRGLTLALELVATWAMVRQARWPAAVGFGLLFAGLPFFSSLSASCLEGSAMISLALLSLYRGGWLLGLVTAMRPEGALLTLYRAVRYRQIRWWAAGVLLPVLWCIAWTGQILPQSVLAKAAVYSNPLSGLAWLTVWLPVYLEGAASDLLWLLPLSGLLLCLSLERFRRKDRTDFAPTLEVGAIAVSLLYAASGAAFFSWYLAIPMLLPLLVITYEARWSVLITAALCIGLTFPVSWDRYIKRGQMEAERFGYIAQFLNQYAKPGESVLLEPIGIIGYTTGLPLVDEVGLTDARVVTERLDGAGWYARLLASRRPVWLVVRAEMLTQPGGFSGRGRPFVGPPNEALRDYQLAFELTAPDGVRRLFYVFHRK